MNPPELIQLAQKVGLDRGDQARLRIAFGVACIERVEHLLTNRTVIAPCQLAKRIFQASAMNGTSVKRRPRQPQRQGVIRVRTRWMALAALLFPPALASLQH